MQLTAYQKCKILTFIDIFSHSLACRKRVYNYFFQLDYTLLHDYHNIRCFVLTNFHHLVSIVVTRKTLLFYPGYTYDVETLSF